MGFEPSARAQELIGKVDDFIRTEIEPVEAELHAAIRASDDPWQPQAGFKDLQAKARKQGLWNLFLPPAEHGNEAYGEGLSNLDYAPIAELTGRSFIAPYVFNCNAPDTGNMEVLLRYGTAEQKQQWLEPLLDGAIRSAFCMTEPDVGRIDNVLVAGKTGTAQTSKDKPPFAWFTAFAPANDPKVAVAVMIEDANVARNDISGGALAAPIAKLVMEAVLGQ